MAAEVVDDHEMREAQRDYLDFLDDDQDAGIYQSKVRDMISENKFRLVVNVNDLRRRNEARAAKLMNNAFDELLAFQRALKDMVASIDATFAKQFEEFFVGLEGSFGSKHVTPRTLTSRLLGSVVCVEGIVTKCSLVRPKVVRSVHYCPATKKTLERRYTDMTSLDAFPSSAIYPTKDEESNPLETEFGLSSYKDHQTITVQEMPEKAPAGQLPRSVDIILDNDLVDLAKPGDRVQVVGTYRCLPGKKGGFTSGTFRTIMVGCHLKQLSKEVTPFFSADDVVKIKNFSKSRTKNVFDQLARSLAPSIHGHEYIKKAILCMLLGGVEKVLENGSRIRGDINVLLIGDPSVAKSQLLRYVLYTAPRAIPTTGRGSSGVGLTAAVTTDQETGERRLEAGAMVLADRGVVCIDEFDKMSDMDRTAIHEVMEQGRVTIAKAGIHARLNARCSVLAAANPVYGRYDQYKTPMENIGLQDSLLSRFDLLFIMLDQMDPEQDREISDHVLRMHRYRDPREQDGAALALGGSVDVLATSDPDVCQEDEEELQVYEKHNHLLHGNRRQRDRVVSKEFMRKYIHVAKALSPVLTQEAASHIAEEYSRLRSQEQLGSDVARTSPVTARTLETLIRLSTAHAKARLSKSVELEDTDVAVALVQFAYFKKVLEKERKRARHGDGDTTSEEEEEEEEAQDASRQPRKRRRSSSTRRPSQDSGPYDPYDFTTEKDIPAIQSPAPSRPSEEAVEMPDQNGHTELSANRLKAFKSALLEVFRSTHAQSVGFNALMDAANKRSSAPFTPAEVRAALDRMQDDNQVMVADDIIFLI
ncbi:DNA replication licensing factor MCM3 isoform X1 [Electrophorus electricus]|uniref:DNA replication licensing factor MCM3 n=1 Tax=Electrophorus electricus TaxID=8005 RepID=A0A4W4EH84_ELEEL|nr:DNA replication licensing factor MCM3 isoform X1 [Electrophorus electricus]